MILFLYSLLFNIFIFSRKLSDLNEDGSKTTSTLNTSMETSDMLEVREQKENVEVCYVTLACDDYKYSLDPGYSSNPVGGGQGGHGHC